MICMRFAEEAEAEVVATALKIVSSPTNKLVKTQATLKRILPNPAKTRKPELPEQSPTADGRTTIAFYS